MAGGVIEGGTWEHRKRAQEMLKTADQALDLTLLNKGKHHIASFLPKVRAAQGRQGQAVGRLMLCAMVSESCASMLAVAV